MRTEIPFPRGRIVRYALRNGRSRVSRAAEQIFALQLQRFNRDCLFSGRHTFVGAVTDAARKGDRNRLCCNRSRALSV
jgi:hypothetical protein